MAKKKAAKRPAKAATSGEPKKVVKRARKPAAKAAPKPMGRPPFQPTEEQRRNVELLVGLGLRREEIRLLVRHPKTDEPIGARTLDRHFKNELDRGVAITHAKVAESLVRRAIDLQHPQGATCAIFYAKCRMGWKERVTIDVDVKSGVLVAPAQLSPEEWIAAAAAKAGKQIEPGTEKKHGAENGNGD